MQRIAGEVHPAGPRADRPRAVQERDGVTAPHVPQTRRKLQPHPGYANIPLSEVAGWRYNHPINLKYPGLQCVYRSSVLGAPVFIVPEFLSEHECDICEARRLHPRYVCACATGTACLQFTAHHVRTRMHATATYSHTRARTHEDEIA
jgi:hypothetical protein